LIGAPLAVRFPRGGPGMVIAVSLMIFGIYYMSLIGGESLGDKGTIRPFWGPWAPNFLFLLLSIGGLVRMGRESATTRGGGWTDLKAAFSATFVPWRRGKAA
jgi:lipopolysaccharide export system permease protein